MLMDRPESTTRSASTVVLSVECLKGSSKADEWSGDMLQTGDIVEEIRIGSGPGSAVFKAPFKGGKSWVQKVLNNSFKSKETSIVVRVRRGSDEFSDLHACIVPNESLGRKQYILRSISDPNYAVGFTDRTESDCLRLQASRTSRLVNALYRAKLQDGFVAYPWERRLQDTLNVPGSSSFLSILFLPKASDKAASRYNHVEDTLARANAWLNASQATGVPIVFMNIQTESLLTKISGEMASSTVNASSLADLSNVANVSLYGFEDYHGVDIGVVRAVRLWYAPLGGEYAVEININEDDTKLGFAISRTEEGFIYISSVIEGKENEPSSRSGLKELYNEAMGASKLLVVSRVSNQKVLPWMVSSTGAIRCYDTVSISQKLSLHRHAKVPILIHVLLWDPSVAPSQGGSRFRAASSSDSASGVVPMAFPGEVRLARQPSDRQVVPLPSDELDDEREVKLRRDTAGEASFRFSDFHFGDNWV